MQGDHTVVCDSCASIILEALQAFLPNDQIAPIPPLLTEGEIVGMTRLVNGWLNTLQPTGNQEVRG
jgi:hypothetical protein